LTATEQEVLIEKNSSHFTGKQIEKLEGRTRTNKIVFIQRKENLVGKTVNVEIVEAYPHSLIGEIKC